MFRDGWRELLAGLRRWCSIEPVTEPYPEGYYWEALKKVTGIYVIWRLSFLVFAFALIHLSSENTDTRFKTHNDHIYSAYWSSWIRWDSFWYGRIADHGYRLEPDDAPSNVMFFPAYPYLSRYLGQFLGIPYFAAGLILSHLSLWLGLFYIFLLGRMFFPEARVRLALILYLLFPSSVFLTAYYGEPLFILGASASLFYFLRERYFWSGAFGCLAMMSRSVGAILIGSYLLVLCVRALYNWRSLRWSMLWLMLIPSGLGAFMYMLYLATGQPWIWATHTGWGTMDLGNVWLRFPLVTPFRYIAHADYSFPRGWKQGNLHHLLNAFMSLALIGVAIKMVVRRYHMLLSTYAILGLSLALYTTKVTSFNRYVLMFFPLFFYIAEFASKSQKRERFLIYSFSFFMSFYALRFFNWYWAG